MKRLLCIILLIVSCHTTIFSQIKIQITITNTDKADIVFFDNSGNKTLPPKTIDFSTSPGSIEIINQTDEKDFAIFIGQTKIANSTSPPFTFPVKSDAQQGKATVTISAGGAISPAFGIGKIITGSNILVKNNNGNEIALFKSADGTGSSSSQVKATKDLTRADIVAFVKKIVRNRKYKRVPNQNLYIDDFGVVHVFLDENLQPILSYFPTTARESNDQFQFHIISTDNNYYYKISSDGEFTPTALGDEIADNGFPKPTAQSTGANTKKVFEEYQSPIFGPYTGTFPFTIEKISKLNNTGNSVLTLTKTIKLLKTNRVSLNIGAVSTWLKNPDNIRSFVKPNGDSTLVADDPDVRGTLIAQITFHLKPRNINVPVRDYREKIGFTFGTNLTGKIGTNFFTGINFEVTNGLCLNGGVHFARVNYVANYRDFKYGEDKFSGTLITLKRWNAGVYLGVNIDAALFTKAFKSFLSSGTTSEPSN